MQLHELTSPRLVLANGRFTAAEEVISFTASRFASELNLPFEDVHQSLVKREALGGTWIGNGTIVPHAHIESMDDIGVQVITVQEQSLVQYQSYGEPLRLIIAIIASRTMATEYLLVLRAVVELVQKHGADLIGARSSEELFALIQQAQVEIHTELTARDLASPATYRVLPTDTIESFVDTVRDSGQFILPAMQPDGTLVGTVDFLDILASCFPEYVLKLPDLAFIREFEPLRSFFQAETTGTISRFVRRNAPPIIEADTSYVEVVFLFVKHRFPLLMVTDAGRLLGTITQHDILHKLTRV